MIYFFKIFGAVFIVISCWGYSVFKTLELKEKRDRMRNFLLGLDSFQNSIRIIPEETIPLFKKCFERYKLFYINDKIIPLKDAFFDKDRDIINEFLSGVGNSDREGECERIKAYKDILNDRYRIICEEYKNKSKVWQTVGLSLGLTVALILI